MSRYTIKSVVDGKEYEVSYGFDRPLSEYFIQVFDNSIEDEDSQCILWVGSRMNNIPNSQMIGLFERWKVPDKHIQQVALDLPF